MPLLVALRQLCGDFGLVAPGAIFQTTDEEAEALEARGLVERYRPPEMKMAREHANKMMRPPANKMLDLPENK